MNDKWLNWAMKIQSIAQAGLAVEKTTKEQILMCFQAHEAEHWKVIVD